MHPDPTDGNRNAKRQPAIDADGLLQELTTRQFLTPHRPLGEVMAELVDRVGACPQVAERAMGRLGLARDQSIGRLRRGELIQLARSMHRLWGNAVAAADAPQTA